MSDKWIGIEAAAEYLDVNKDSIRNWIKKESGIPAHKIVVQEELFRRAHLKTEGGKTKRV